MWSSEMSLLAKSKARVMGRALSSAGSHFQSTWRVSPWRTIRNKSPPPPASAPHTVFPSALMGKTGGSLVTSALQKSQDTGLGVQLNR